MSALNLETPQPQIPVFSAIREETLERLLRKWLGKPDLEEVILVSFNFDPRYKQGDATLAKKLELLASSTEVTLVTALPEGNEKERIRARDHRRVFQTLVSSGVHVLIHNTLHAKVYLFRRGDRVCWGVGSSNLTFGGLSGNVEVNVTGYRSIEYLEVFSRVRQIMDEAYPA